MPTFTAGPETRVNTTTVGAQTPGYHGHTVTGLPSGGFIEVWSGLAGTNPTTGAPYSDIFMQRYDRVGNPIGTETRVNTTVGNDHQQAQIVFLKTGGFIVVWTAYGQDGSTGANGGGSIYFQLYDAAGAKVGVETQANTTILDEQDTPSVVALDSGFVITWDSFGQDGDRYGEYGQQFDANGVKINGELRVSTSNTGTQDSSSLASTDAGLAVVYNHATAFDIDGNATDYDIFMQLRDETGAIGSEVTVNTTKTGNQYFSSVSTMIDGGFLVTWVSTPTGGGISTIYSQRFSNTGVKVGGEVKVNTTATGSAQGASVTLLTSGGYVIAWSMSDGAATPNFNMYLQQYDAFGNKVGAEVLVSNSAGNQIWPTVTAQADGSFVVSYRGPDGNSTGVFHRVFYVDKTFTDPVAGGHTIVGDYGSDVMNGLDGDDDLFGGQGPGRDTLNGGDGNDTLRIWGGDNAYGGAGDDRIVLTHLTGEGVFFDAGSGNDTLDASGEDGGPGWIFTNSQNLENYIGGAFADNLDAHLVTNIAVFNFSGGDGNDVIKSGSGADVLKGDAGDDYIDGGLGADSMTGGIGNDTFVVDNAGDTITELNGGGTDTVMTAMTYSLAGTFIENLTLTGTGNVNGTGSNAVNVLTGNDGNNQLDGGAAADTLIGGKGNDTYIVDNTNDVVTEAAGEGTDLVRASANFALTTNVENLDLTGAATKGIGNDLDNVINGTVNANVLQGGLGNDTLNGLDGNDNLYGEGGNDTIDGGIGADIMAGGAGDDSFYVDNAGDKVSELNNAGNDTVYSSVTFAVGGQYIENVVLTGTANINANGNGLNNTFTGNSGNNTFNGGVGADTMTGGLGDDVYYVDNIGDVTNEEANGGRDTVSASLSWTLGANIEVLTLSGFQAINGTGNALDNTIAGNGNINILSGGDGKDVLKGLGGNDILTGGNGADQFRFEASGAANGVDHITDFVSGTDKLVFNSADYGFAKGHVLTAAELHGGAAVGAGPQFLYNSVNHTLYFDSDGAGGTGAVAVVVFDNLATPVAGDFAFV